MKVVYRRKTRQAENIYSFYFQPKLQVDYVAGQFIELFLPHSPADSRSIKRWFTLSSAPGEDLLAITTKFDKISSSFKQTLKKLKPGQVVDMTMPMGDFVLPKNLKYRMLFVVGGIGITPVRSMLTWLHLQNLSTKNRLIYATTDDQQKIFVDSPAFSKTKIDFVGPKKAVKRLSATYVLEIAKEFAADYIYLSGPEGLVEALTEDIRKKITPGVQLVTDYFPGYDRI